MVVSYAGKLVLAPMVRAGELPTRLLALQHGADLVWSPEIIDKKLIQCERFINDKLKTVDFIISSPKSNGKPKSPTLVFRTHPQLEKGKIIFQIGTSTPSLATEAALKVIEDVDGIDVNAGCPKHFSIHSGMGAALLKTPDKLCAILKELVEKVGKPYNKSISVKIRILEEEATTLELVENLCLTGIHNLTVHCRTAPMRNREAPIRDYIPKIHQICKKHKVSLIMNGAVRSKTHYNELLQELQLPLEIGGMMADCAESNPTVFSKNPLPWYDVVREYLKIAQSFDNHTSNTKYMLSRLVPGKSKLFQFFARCKTPREIEYVVSQLGEKGELLSDPSNFLQSCRNEEKLAKQKEHDKKTKLKQAEKRQLINVDDGDAKQLKKMKSEKV
ncbi:hypothetical protein HG535_0A07110 [Zygotorulaspora mrakii]|uniref:tRNA-dihydrouridine synthase n=1 Tax=Zygotorulaspora mrakii TaxID=42260 RepID=A0A7H9AYB8_ZYGMR|nr:uncharacterized protein HG535_0A07110 [Zygotorulaspora mrakii]QLG70769.1 hypothetical protein HG535_0A07110 [Zygotorulaspora mrakii]